MSHFKFVRIIKSTFAASQVLNIAPIFPGFSNPSNIRIKLILLMFKSMSIFCFISTTEITPSVEFL